MSNLTQDQLKILTELNNVRLAISTEFKSNEEPSAEVVMRELLKMEVLMMENKNKEHLEQLMEQNEANLSMLIDNLVVSYESDVPVKKIDAKWGQDNVAAIQEIKVEQTNFQEEKRPFRQQFPYALRNQENSKPPQVPSVVKAIVPGQFVSAGTLPKGPKGASVRKKFVPPYKKPDVVKEADEKQESDSEKDPVFKNLESKLVNVIMSEILEKGAEVKWSSIAGLGFAKKIIHEMIVWPMMRPDIFTGLRAPPRAILLFGPPGTGKTLIGRAIASQAEATFFSISASSLTSKWVGESEKLVKTLFAIARAKQPSVIFIDEIDSLLSSRGEGEQESSRRVKTQFLVQLDGAKTSTSERVLIIGATNLPQELDDAVRRRFVKRLYIPLPNPEGRQQLIKNLTSNPAFQLSQDDIFSLVKKTKGFSGADLYNLCSEASMVPLRELTSSIRDLRHSEVPCSQLRHFQEALTFVRPSVNRKMLRSFEQFNELYGSYQFSENELKEDGEGSEHIRRQKSQY